MNQFEAAEGVDMSPHRSDAALALRFRPRDRPSSNAIASERRGAPVSQGQGNGFEECAQGRYPLAEPGGRRRVR